MQFKRDRRCDIFLGRSEICDSLWREACQKLPKIAQCTSWTAPYVSFTVAVFSYLKLPRYLYSSNCPSFSFSIWMLCFIFLRLLIIIVFVFVLFISILYSLLLAFTLLISNCRSSSFPANKTVSSAYLSILYCRLFYLLLCCVSLQALPSLRFLCIN